MDISSVQDKMEKDDGTKGLQRQLTRSSQTIGITTVVDSADSLQRRLGNRQIQLIAIGMSTTTPSFPLTYDAASGKKLTLSLYRWLYRYRCVRQYRVGFAFRRPCKLAACIYTVLRDGRYDQ